MAYRQAWVESPNQPYELIRLSRLADHFAQTGLPLPSVRLIRFAKLTVLIADVATIFCAFLVVGWQIIIFLRGGNWRALPLSLVFNTPNNGDVYSTASINKIGESRVTDFTDVLLQMPIIMPVLLAAAFLTGFYLWLSSLEREISILQIQ